MVFCEAVLLHKDDAERDRKSPIPVQWQHTFAVAGVSLAAARRTTKWCGPLRHEDGEDVAPPWCCGVPMLKVDPGSFPLKHPRIPF